jgi:hypothetical protein
VLAAIMPGIDVQIKQGQRNLSGNPNPCLKSAMKEREQS